MTRRFELHQENLKKIFSPESVAIVGATKLKGTVPYDIVENILKSDFNGAVYPVSPREKHIASVKAYKYLVDIEDPVDLAIIVFPSAVVHMALEQCGQKGIKSVIIISAGFREIGEKGIAREEQIKAIAKKYDISFIGPNCLGVINTDPTVNLDASFARKMPDPGNIGFLSQSGALCTAVLDYARAKHIGFSKFISFGNKADISEIDLMFYLMKDEQTKVILLYLEEVSDGKALIDAAREVIAKSGKPILILKSGRTSEGASAAASHTGSLAGSDEVCNAAFEQAGILRCDNIEEMFNKAMAFAYQPPPRSNRVAIITNAGGPGVLTTDAAVHEGLEIAKFSEATTKILKRHLPSTANINNPVDVIGDARADRYNAALTAVINDEAVDGVFVILTPQSMTNIEEIAEEIVNVAKDTDKPIYTSFMGEADVAVGVDILLRNKIPHYILPESMCKAFESDYRFNHFIKKHPYKAVRVQDVNKNAAREVLDKTIQSGRTILEEDEAGVVLGAYGLPVLKGKLAHSAEEAISIAQEIGFPVAMKIMSDDIIHKFDTGGVMLDVKNEKEVKDKYQEILKNVKSSTPEAAIRGIWVTQMAEKGEEVILGIKRDPAFGPVIMFGLGGIFVEIFKDVKFRVAPLGEHGAKAMVESIKGYKLLAGARGKTPADIASIIDCIYRLSQLAIDFPEITELDINPIIVYDEGKGCAVADTKIMF
jgi:acetyltransferase